MLALIYVLIFLLALGMLIRSVRIKRGFGPAVLLDLVAAAAALVAMGYYDRLSQRNALAGWAYFPEVFSSLCAAVVFGLLALVGVAIWLLRRK